MGKIRGPIPVKLFIGMLSPEPSLFATCAEMVRKEYGPIDTESEILSWGTTEYYQDEMGPGIMRKFIFFEELKDAISLPEVKIFTNRIEQQLSVQGGGKLHRRINLDPGYVTEAKVVLASTKDFSHRIYVGEGIYAEVTLRYANAERSFAPLDYTYPDYRTETYRSLFNTARGHLRTSLDRK